ncbi:MAG: sugar ABC transporter substrate-binding protein, partial [Oscillospiraceae bacterium]|nr:sugar ABC transporter substrate-binding protein [Oscillospiraceae bacterium]
MKKFLCLVVSALVVLAMLAGCADNSATPSNTPDVSNDTPNAAPDNTPDTPDDAGGGAAIKIGIVNNPPSESGYREANVKDFEAVFTAANGYDV